ncbi:MAG: two-component regulator propeller domain-containing protein, partial [Bacteroidota bacterium]
NNTVLALHEDQAGNLWVGLDRGMNLIVRSESLRYFSANQQALGTVYAAIHAQGYFYLGTNQGLFVKSLDQDNEEFTLLPGTAGQVWELRETKAGLLCGHNEGTFLIKGRKAELISNFTGGWQTIEIPGDTLRLLQSTYTGLVLLTAINGRWKANYLSGLVAPLRFLTLVGDREVYMLHSARGAYRASLSQDYRQYEKIDTIVEPDLAKPALSIFPDQLLIHSNGKLFELEESLIPLDKFAGEKHYPGTAYLAGHPDSRDWFKVENGRIHFFMDGARPPIVLPLHLRQFYPRIIHWLDGSYLFCLDEGYAILDGTFKEP